MNNLLNCESLVDVLAARAHGLRGDETAYTFLKDGEGDEASITYRQLHARALAIARELRARVEPGSRAVLLFPSGLEFIEAFMGCLYAGVIAVPCSPPHPLKLEAQLPHLERVVLDCSARTLLGTREYMKALESRNLSPLLRTKILLKTDTIEADGHDAMLKVAPESVAFLQYTSGSTSKPSGVMVRHRNILANASAIHEVCRLDANSCAFSWLPFFHDMGLIGKILYPLCAGARSVIMSPLHFVDKPARWVRGISKYGASLTAAPNFAYELCARSTDDETMADLDLHKWRVAISGAEPVHHGTLNRFVARFQSAGFRRSAFHPSFGLAESTLIASGLRNERELQILWVDRAGLATGEIAQVPNGAGTPLVSCGAPSTGSVVKIVDPEWGFELSSNRVGEIWLAGPSICGGYWGDAPKTARTFEARMDGHAAPFLRTGDLGFMANGELFVTGRMKELIILNGRNLYPQDIEFAVREAHVAFATAAGAAFAVDDDGAEALVVAFERDRRSKTPVEELARVARKVINETFDVPVHDVVILAPRSIQKTSSGKTKRVACRKAYLGGSLPTVYSSRSGHAEQTHRPGIQQVDIGRWTWEDQPPDAPQASASATAWVLIVGGDPSCAGVEELLRRQGGESYVVDCRGWNSDVKEQVREWLAAQSTRCRGIVFIPELRDDGGPTDEALEALSTASSEIGCLSQSAEDEPRVFCVSRGHYAVKEETSSNPHGIARWARAHALVGGLARTCIDLEVASHSRDARMIAFELRQPVKETVVAFRGSARFIARLDAVEATSTPPSAVVSNRRYEMTMLLGPDGSLLDSLAAVARGKLARHLLSVSPREEAQRVLNAAHHFSAMGTLNVDVLDPDALRGLSVEAAAQGFYADELIAICDWDASDPLATETVHRFASNLTALARSLRVGRVVLLFGDIWSSTGSMSAVSPAFAASLGRLGAGANSRSSDEPACVFVHFPRGFYKSLDGFSAELFGQLLAAQPGTYVVAPSASDLRSLFSRTLPESPLARLQSNIVATSVSAPEGLRAEKLSAKPPRSYKNAFSPDDVTRAQLLLCRPDDRVRAVADLLHMATARLLGVDKSRVDMARPLTEAGLDSVATAELRTAMERHLKVRIPMSALITGPTGNGLAGVVAEIFQRAISNSQQGDGI